MVMIHSYASLSRITINNISIPLTPLSPYQPFTPSSETIKAWYLAHYGTPNLLELDPETLTHSIEELATWWTQVKSDVRNPQEEVIDTGYLIYEPQICLA